MVRKDMLEELIVNAIVDELSKKPIMDDMVAELLKEQNRQCAENTKVSIMKREKAKVDKALDNLVMALEQGIMSATTNKRLHELEKQQAELRFLSPCNFTVEVFPSSMTHFPGGDKGELFH